MHTNIDFVKLIVDIRHKILHHLHKWYLSFINKCIFTYYKLVLLMGSIFILRNYVVNIIIYCMQHLFCMINFEVKWPIIFQRMLWLIEMPKWKSSFENFSFFDGNLSYWLSYRIVSIIWLVHNFGRNFQKYAYKFWFEHLDFRLTSLITSYLFWFGVMSIRLYRKINSEIRAYVSTYDWLNPVDVNDGEVSQISANAKVSIEI